MAIPGTASKDESCLLVRVLDGFSLESTKKGRIPLANRKACGLLAYLALSANSAESRERLAGLLWSDRSEDLARASLRQSLKQLRSFFDSHGLLGFHTDRQETVLEKEKVRVDVKELSTSLTQGKVPQEIFAANIAPERILYGLDTLDSAFGAWVRVIRQTWQTNLTSSLLDLLRGSDHDETTRGRAADLLVKIDPTNEEAQRFIIAKFADSGNTPAALKRYNELWQLLEDEYDAEPSEETQALIVRLKSGTYTSEIRASASSKPSIAAVQILDP